MTSFTRKAMATWIGSDQGEGVLSSQSHMLQRVPYTRESRFGDVRNTNPEELLAAAHASCFSMALDDHLASRGFKASRLDVACAVTVTSSSSGFTITKSALDLVAHVEGLDHARFLEIATVAKDECSVSRLFDTEIELTVRLVT